MRVTSAAIGFLFAMCLTACAWVPDSGQYVYDRGVIPEETSTRFVPGSSTRADVVSFLGAPAWVSPNEDRLIYRVRYVTSYWWVYLVAGLPTGSFCDIRSHLFEFDPSGSFLDYRLVVESAHHGGEGGPEELLHLDQMTGVDYAAYFDAADSSSPATER